MKKLLGILVLGLLWCNLGFSKIINIENKITLDLPKNHKYIKFEEDDSMGDVDLSEIFEAFEIFEPDIFVTGPDKLIDFYQSLINGKDPMDNYIVSSLVKRLERKAKSSCNPWAMASSSSATSRLRPPPRHNAMSIVSS